MEHGEEPQGQPAPPGSGAHSAEAFGPPPTAETRVQDPSVPAGAAPAAVLDAPPPVVTDRRLACPRCGEVAEPGQDVCLRCGALVGRAYRPPPSWRLPAALAALGVLLIGAGVGFGVAELTHKKTSHNGPISLTPSQPVAPTPTVTTPPPVAKTPTGPSGPSGASGASGPSGTGGAAAGALLTSWPADKSGWTVVLGKFDDQAKAQDRARAAAAKAISAGVLRGADYKGFPQGQWIAFMGQYDKRAAAARAAKQYAAKGFSGQPHQVTPKKKP